MKNVIKTLYFPDLGVTGIVCSDGTTAIALTAGQHHTREDFIKLVKEMGEMSEDNLKYRMTLYNELEEYAKELLKSNPELFI